MRSLEMSIGAVLVASVAALSTSDVIGYLLSFVGFLLVVSTFILRRELNRILDAIELVHKLDKRVSYLAAKLDIDFTEGE